MHSYSTNPHEIATELVRRAQVGDRSAFGELVRRYRERIFALVLHLTGNEDDADDVTQEVFCKAFQSIHHFAGRSEFFTWIYRIAVNRALNVKRDGSRLGKTSIDDPRISKAIAADAWGDPVRAAELRQSYARLLQALDNLPPEIRTTVVLVILQGFNYAEAAIIQDCPAGTIAWRIHKAREHLNRAMIDKRDQHSKSYVTLTASSKNSDRRSKPHTISAELQVLLDTWGLPVPISL